MKKQNLAKILKFIFCYTPLITATLFLNLLNAQDYPYPLQPHNTSTINDSSPTLEWIQNSEFTNYTIQIYEAKYNPGDNFNSIKLENYVLKYAKQGQEGYEASGLAHNEIRKGIFVTIDDQATDLISYNNSFDKNNTLTGNVLNGNQYEGITYMYDDYFAIVEEIGNILAFAKFNYNFSNNLGSINLINKVTAISSDSDNSNNGFEGLTYNPKTNKMYLVREFNPVAIYEFNAPVAPNFNQSVVLNEPFRMENVNWKPRDLAGISHLGLNKELSATNTGEHILLLSEEDISIFEIDLKGNLVGKKIIDPNSNPNLPNPGFFKPEGIAYEDGIIWIASEGFDDAPAYFYGYENENHQNPETDIVKLVYTKSNITGTKLTIPERVLESDKSYCWKLTAKNSNGQFVESTFFNFTTKFEIAGCTDASACNYDERATQSNGLCSYEDCRGVCGGTKVKGTICNNITNYVYDENCNCKKPGCLDKTACNFDPSAQFEDNSCNYPNFVGTCFCQENVSHEVLSNLTRYTFYAQNELSTSVKVIDRRDLFYYAGKSIELKAGFEIGRNASLTTKIQSCSP